MATAIPALRGQMGNTEYFLTTMNIGEFVTRCIFPESLPQWETLTIEEKFQRELNHNRVRKEIAPYFANDPGRFSNALVLAVINDEGMDFEGLNSLIGRGSSFPQLYRSAAENLGFLTLSGSEVLVPLDGQHRAKAFKYAIEGKDDNGRPIASIEANLDLATEQVSVLLVRYDNKKARDIFNKLNKYAKATSKADNLVTDDDNAIAAISRALIGDDGVLPARLVRIGGNTLPANALEFTTLPIFYDSNTSLVEGLKIAGAGRMQDMDKAQATIVQNQLHEKWDLLLDNIDLWRKATEDPSQKGDKTRIEIREQTLLGKPVAQLSLVRAFTLMRDRCAGVSDSALCDRLNKIPWDVDNSTWHNVLMNPNGRIMSGRGTVNRASEYIAHLGGAPLTREERDRLLSSIYGEDYGDATLPHPVA